MKRLAACRLAAVGLCIVASGCAGARVDPQLSAEPRLEATIDALGERLAALRLEQDSLRVRSDSLAASADTLRLELARLRLELQRLKDIDLRRKPARP